MFDDHRVMPLSIFSALSVDIFKFKRNRQNLKIIVSNLYVKQWYVSEQFIAISGDMEMVARVFISSGR